MLLIARCLLPWIGPQVFAQDAEPAGRQVPGAGVHGDGGEGLLQYCLKFPGFEAALRGGAMESFAPDLKIAYIPEGSHFVQEQLPEQVNELLLGFLKDHPVVAA